MTTKKTKKLFIQPLVAQPASPIIASLHVDSDKKPRAKKETPAVTFANAGSVVTKRVDKKRPLWLLCLYWILIATSVGAICFVLGKYNAGNIAVTDSVYLEEEPLRIGSADISSSAEYRESGKQKLIEGDTVGALNDFTIAIERNPTDSLNYIFRGEILMAGSNYVQAVSDFNNAVRLDPTAVVAYYDRALAHIKMEQLDDAKRDLDFAVNAYAAAMNTSRESVTDMPVKDIYAKRAQVNLWLRNWAEAESDYTAAIAQNFGESDWLDFTGRAEARTNLSNFHNAITDYVSAVTIISEKIQKTPDEKSRENMSRQAMGYFEKSGALRVTVGQMDLALQDLQAAHTLAIALGDSENQARLQTLMSNIDN